MVLQVAWNQNGNWLLTTSRDKVRPAAGHCSILRYPAVPPPPALTHPITHHLHSLSTPPCHPPNPGAVIAGRQTLKLFDLRMMGEILTMTSDLKEVTAVAWHPHHETMFASGGSDGSLLAR